MADTRKQGFSGMGKQKLFSILSALGAIFVLMIGIQYVRMLENRGAVIEQRVEVPESVSRQFRRVISKNRLKPMPDASFLSPKGEEVTWAAFEGHYLLVNFWASWCAPCVTELPSLDKLAQKFSGKGLDVIAVSLDKGRSHAEIKQYLHNRNIGNFAAFWDHQDDVQRNIHMRGIPTTYLLDPRAHVLYIFEGDANWNAPEVRKFFQTILDKKI